MAIKLTPRTQALTTSISQKPQLILKIKGDPRYFGIGLIKKFVRIGDPGLEVGNDWKIGGYNNVENQLDLISLDGTTNSVAQQLSQDKGGTSSISAIQISLLDKDGLMTKLITPGEVFTDILGLDAEVYLGYQETAFPQDFIVLFQGVIDEITATGTIILNIAHPDQKKRVNIFTKTTTELVGALNNSATTITVTTTEGYLLPADGGTLRTYVRIDDEVIEYTGLTPTTFTGCVRGAFVLQDGRTLAKAHDDGASVDSWYRLIGPCMDLALKIMLSGVDQYFAEDVDVGDFVDVEQVGLIPNAIYFPGINVDDRYGIVTGDFITTTGDIYAANNVSLKTISQVARTPFGSYIVVDGVSFVQSNGSPAVISFASKYNVLPDAVGLNMGGTQVDVPEFERIKSTFAGSLLTYDFYMKDTVVAKDFIDTQLLFPTGAYSLPRKGKTSVGFTSPPLRISDTKKLDHTNTIKPQTNSLKRSTNKYFYNNIVYVYHESVIDDGKFLRGTIADGEDSKNQIKVGNKNFVIFANGLRPTGDTLTQIELISKRLLDRWQFAAESIKIQGFYGDLFAVDVGDIVLYGSPELQLPDTKSASRNFKARLFEMVNKTLYIKDGYVAAELVDTNYLTDGRYGIFSPSSFVDAGSTTTLIKIKKSFQLDDLTLETDKWSDYLGQKILVHSEDWSYQEETRLLGFTGSGLQVEALSGAPLEDYLVDIVEYFVNPLDDTDGSIYKNVHCFFDPAIEIDSAASDTVFTVASGEGAKFFNGGKVVVHSEDFSTLSPERTVSDVSGDQITVSGSLGYTPAPGDIVDLIGFSDDNGAPYRYI